MTSENERPQVGRVTLSDLRKGALRLEGRVAIGGERLVVFRSHKPAWGMVSLADLARLLGTDEQALVAALEKEEDA